MTRRAGMLAARTAAFAWLLSVNTWSSSASAGDAVAEQLYQDGRRAATAKDWDLACKLFRESHDREPAPGTLLNLANCEENRGALLAARAHFDAAAKSFRPDDKRAAYAVKRLAALDARIPKLTVRLSPKAPEGTVIERNGVALGSAILGVPASLDPGAHTLTIKIPGEPDETMTLQLAPGDSREIEVGHAASARAAPIMRRPAENGASGAAAEKTPANEPLRAAEPVTREGRSSSAFPYLFTGIGVVGLGAFTYFGLHGKSDYSALERTCAPECPDDRVEAVHDKLLVADVALGVSVVAFGAAVVLWLTAPKHSH